MRPISLRLRNDLVLVVLGVTIVASGARHGLAEDRQGIALLYQGKAAQAEQVLGRALEREGTDELRYELGVVRFVGGIERMGQSFYRYGSRSLSLGFVVPFLRMPVPENDSPATLTYAEFRGIFERLVRDLDAAEQTLAGIGDHELKLTVDLQRIQLDLRGDGRNLVPLSSIASRYLGGRRRLPATGLPQVTFDRGDVAWLRGYCHLLSAMAETFLAYDSQRMFDHVAHAFFAKVDSPFPFLSQPTRDGRGFDTREITDLIAAVHLVNWKLSEPERLKRAHAHLRKTLALSRESWEWILAETDNDQEWLPSPRQAGAIGVGVSQAQIDAWLEFTKEADRLLTGKRLIPFWRGDGSLGVNLKRAFLEPRDFDLVLWVQGPAAAPYLEKGNLTDQQVWSRLSRVFRGEFIGFAFWFN